MSDGLLGNRCLGRQRWRAMAGSGCGGREGVRVLMRSEVKEDLGFSCFFYLFFKKNII